ncbi:M56/M15 family metallopeptidase [Pedobacter aquatilis]|uniref:M56/M15 family metallopeptidase n=1 Tax=Pedobacter aquatilis TaxID=351343 RepID=UPI0029316718|nr:M56/M15 family metallopeptidase [Pedobacter aquatilis]
MILIYFLKVSLCLLVFFTAYKLLLAKLTFFKLNRAYLLAALMISFIIPALTVEHKREVIVQQAAAESKIQYSTDTAYEADYAASSTSVVRFNWPLVASYAYGFVALFLLLRTIYLMGCIKHSLRKSTLSNNGSLILVAADSKIKNCSFFNQIIIDASLLNHEKELVVKHESVHVKQRHMIDKLIVNLAACILWINPVIYLWRNEIDNNHEFLADEETAGSTDKGHYASLLLNLALPSNNLMANNFSKLPLKNRIMMIYKKPDANFSKFTYLIVIPIISVCCFAFVNQKDIIITKMVKTPGTVNEEQASLLPLSPILSPAEITTDSVFKGTADQGAKTIPAILDANAISSNKLELDEVPENTAINTEIKKVLTGKELLLVIDAGHGGKDGASKSQSGIAEKDLNLRAAKMLREEAEKRNIKVVLTREKDEFIPLRDRLPAENATAFISIHHNNMPKPNTKVPFEGIEVFVSQLNSNIKNAEQFGAGVLKSLNQIKGIEVRDSLKNANLLVLRESKVPAIVIELGNLSSERSLAYVSDDKNLRAICNLILDGFLTYTKS